MAYLVIVGVMVVLDPIVRDAFGEAPYGLLLFSHVQNAVVPLTITFILLRYTDVRRRAAEARVDELLTNAIPAAIADAAEARRATHRGRVPGDDRPVRRHRGLHALGARTPPDAVVELLDELFTRFDELHRRARPREDQDDRRRLHGRRGVLRAAGRPCRAAIELARAIMRTVADVAVRRGLDLAMRVGLASGPVVGGVIGTRRLLFDLWGDTVNLAARMESSGVPGRIQVATSTRELLGDRCQFEPRAVDVKGLGRMTTHLV